MQRNVYRCERFANLTLTKIRLARGGPRQAQSIQAQAANPNPHDRQNRYDHHRRSGQWAV